MASNGASGSISDVYISGTEDDPAVLAEAALAAPGNSVLAELMSKVALLTDLELPPHERDRARNGLASWCAERLPRYFTAVDQALYAPAAGASETRLLIRALRTLHQRLAAHIAALDRVRDMAESRSAADAVAAVLAASVELEHSVLLPALAALPGVDLPSLVADFDTVLAGGELRQPAELDVREIPHGRRHPKIFGRYAALAPGESFVLVNNHDPKPLRREFEAAYMGQFGWEYVESGPDRWRVRISRLPEGIA